MRIKQIILFLIIASSVYSQITNTRRWRYTERDSLDNAILLYEEQNYVIALPIFEKVYQNHPKEEFIKYLYGICCLYRSDKYEECLTALSEVYANNPRIDQLEYDLARAYHYNYKFDEALDMLAKHLSYKRIRPEDKAKGELLKSYVINAKYYHSNPTKAKVVNGGSINSEADELTPVISADESVMIFNYIGPKSKGGKMNARLQPDENGIYTSDIYMSQKKNNVFQTPVALDYINSNAPDAVISLSQDGQILFTYKDVTDGHGDIYASYLTGDKYSQPVKLRGKVNSYSWDGHCSLSPDGRTLYFSSERNGGYGGKDLYKATMLADSTWGKIVNLGDSVNTEYDEDSPFIHSDGTTLFYSSKSLKSSGGYDIFRSVMEMDSTFKKVDNVGYPINTPDNDIYFVLAANGARGYYSSGKKGGVGLSDIYVVETAFDNSRSSILLVKGNILKNNETVDAEIKVEVTSKNNAIYKKLRSNNGKYMVSLPAGAQYKITFAKNNLPPQVLSLSTMGIKGFVERDQNIDFERSLDTVKTIVTPTVQVASVTPTTAVSKVNTATITAAKTPTNTSITAKNTVTTTSTATVAVAKVNTPTVAATPTVTVKNTSTLASTPTVTTAKTNTTSVASTPTTSTVKTPTVITTPTVAAVKTNTQSATPTTNTTIAAPTTSFTPPARPANMTVETFIPLTAAQEKIRIFTEKYPDVSADSLDFRVQIAAFKNPKVYDFPHLKNCGKLENLLLLDGITRLTIGGSFNTLRKAYEHNKKVVVAGQNDAFVTVIYKNRRVTLEDLETMGIFKRK